MRTVATDSIPNLTTPTSNKRFLVIDHNGDTGELLMRSLRRKYPEASIMHTTEAEDALQTIASVNFDAIVLHRAFEADAVTLVRSIRAFNATVPIVVLSHVDRTREVVEAGANLFLGFEQWLLLGSVIASAVATAPERAQEPDIHLN